jgi:hypothetical protein
MAESYIAVQKAINDHDKESVWKAIKPKAYMVIGVATANITMKRHLENQIVCVCAMIRVEMGGCVCH